MYFKIKMENPKGRRGGGGGVHDYGILRVWGITHSGISKCHGGLKHGSRPSLAMDIF